jgi:hypothetical protein
MGTGPLNVRGSGGEALNLGFDEPPRNSGFHLSGVPGAGRIVLNWMKSRISADTLSQFPKHPAIDTAALSEPPDDRTIYSKRADLWRPRNLLKIGYRN